MKQELHTSSITIDDNELKALLKQALIELFKEKNDILQDALAEVVEETGLIHAIKKGQASPVVGKVVNSSLGTLFSTLYPTLWSLLNAKAQKNLPSGLREYILPDDAMNGLSFLGVAEEKVAFLFERIGKKRVSDCYTRDLSGVDSEKRLSELLCEISLVAELSKLSAVKPQLRPKNENGRECDVMVRMGGVDLYVECKRLEDRGPLGRRSIAKSVGLKPASVARPRSMDIYSKLHLDARVYGQFPRGTVNIVFLFHRSWAESVRYIRQALFGDHAFFEEGNEVRPQNDGLFATEEWTNISGCVYGTIDIHGKLILYALWDNPGAMTPVPEPVWTKIKQLNT